MENEIIIDDPELGNINISKKGELDAAIKEIEDDMPPTVVQKVSSGVGVDSLRKFKDAIDRGDKKLAQEAIDGEDNADIKASMQRLMKFL